MYLDVDFMTGYNVRSYLLLSITLACIAMYLLWESTKLALWEIKKSRVLPKKYDTLWFYCYDAVMLRPDTF